MPVRSYHKCCRGFPAPESRQPMYSSVILGFASSGIASPFDVMLSVDLVIIEIGDFHVLRFRFLVFHDSSSSIVPSCLQRSTASTGSSETSGMNRCLIVQSSLKMRTPRPSVNLHT